MSCPTYPIAWVPKILNKADFLATATYIAALPDVNIEHFLRVAIDHGYRTWGTAMRASR